jgi:hypothetical protein
VEKFAKFLLTMYPQSNVIGSDAPNEEHALALLPISEHTEAYSKRERSDIRSSQTELGTENSALV